MTSTLPADLTVAVAGPRDGRAVLVLHGGGGPMTVAPLAAHLAARYLTLMPTHPGWEGTERPAAIDSVAALATAYLDRLLADGDRDVALVGSSIGGWIALEMAYQASTDDRYTGLIGAVVDIDGVGAVVEGHPLADFFALTPRELAEAAWHDPDRGSRDPATLTDEQRAILRSNAETMKVVAGPGMSDPTLLTRLQEVRIPTLVLSGESDLISTPAYGRAVAAAIPNAQFVEIPAAGHLPHLENPDATWPPLDAFLVQH